MKRNLVRSLLTVVFLLAMGALPALAQETFSVATTPINVRGEGLKEAIGPVILGATTTGTIVTNSAIYITFPAGVTVTGPGALNCNFATPCPTMTATVPTATPNVLQISFTGSVALVPGNTITASGLRVNANALLSTSVVTLYAGLSAVVPPASLATNPIGFLQPSVPVAYVQPHATTVTGTTLTELSCVTVDGDFTITVTENFTTAFTSFSDEAALTPPPAPAPTNGLQILITITNVPAGVTITAPSTVTPIAPSTVTATLDVSSIATVVSTGAPISFLYDLTTTTASATTIDSILFDFTADFPTSLPTGLPSPAVATVSLSPTAPLTPIPLFAVGNVEGTVNAIAISDCITTFLFPWVTNFNYAGSTAANAHYDTGIVIANTTTDPFVPPSAKPPGGGALRQSGTCSLTMFPDDGSAPVPYVTPVIGSGTSLVFTAGGAYPGKSGYVMGTCNFQNGHGYAYIVDNAGLGDPHTAANYLGLIVPNTNIWPRNPASVVGCGPFGSLLGGEGGTGAPCGTGESLGQ